MSIQAIRLRNFRGFRDAELKLKRLTVLLGSNSSGKSSFGHALAAMTHAHRYYRGTPQATLTPSQDDAKNWPVDLGGLSDLRTTGAEGPVTIELSTDAGLIKLGFGLNSVPGLVPSYFAVPEGQESPDRRVKSGAWGIRIEREKNPIIGATTDFTTGAKSKTYYEEKPAVELRRLNESQWVEGGVPSVVILEGLLPKGFAHEGGTSRPVSRSALNELEFLFDHLTYLRATRRRPFRTYAKELGRQQRIGYGGEYTAAILQEERQVEYAQLPRIEWRASKQQRVQNKSSIKKEALSSAVREWIKRLGIARSVESIRAENDRDRLRLMVTLPGQERHNVTEVGFGVSQILPILTAGLMQPNGSLFVVDLPEAHLHPKPQAEIADFFCSLALSGRYSLVETHSEMFFHRLRLRAEMIPDLKNEIAVYFLDGSEGSSWCKPPRAIGLGLDDEPNWPADFFQEGWDMEVQIGSLRRARKPT